ncbi:MAG: NACHT domain-containing protein, partial [Caldilineaceae bacterium]|nr:NACHT domain-containing protein [Caldilineaceae bacterium]
MGLYTLLGNVGTGLVTNLIQEWKDREEAETLAELPGAIAAQVAADDEAQATFDKLINELETVRLTLESGALPDPQAFVDALLAEKQALGSAVEVHGDWITVGAITDAQNIAVGRNINQTNIGTQNNIYQTPPDPSKPDLEQLRRAYLHWVYGQSDMLSLSGVDPKAKSGEAHLSLGAVYTALLTMTPEDHERWLLTAEGAQANARMPERDARRLSAIDLLNRHRHVVLLGDPGSGKSTLVNFVALCLAGEGLGKAEANVGLLTAPLPVEDEAERNRNRRAQKAEQAAPQPWDHGALLPVRVVLRDFAARGLPAPGVKATADHLWKFICAELPGEALGDYAPLLRNELQQKGGLLLLDGLDEVPDADQRRDQIKQAVEEFVVLFPNCRILVTSRTYAYQQQEWRLRGFTETILAPFTDSQIRHFVDRWYAHMATVRSLDHSDAQGRAELLKRAIFAAPGLHELAERPLLLTLTASIHAWRGGTLPDCREELYDAAVDMLLDWWESQRVVRDEAGNLLVVQPSLVEWLKTDRAAIRSVLNRLAFEAHQGQAQLVGTADIPEKELVYALFDTSDDHPAT